MWKKDEVEPPMPTAPRPQERAPRPEVHRSSGAVSERATIGRSITIKGEVSGDEDLLIQGRVDGSVDLLQHAVTVGADGRVKANINARLISVEGEVEGDLTAQEQVVLRSSARVQGDLTAPRVILEDGATFRGLVDMGDPDRDGSSGQEPKAQPKGAAETSRNPQEGLGKTSPDSSKTSPELALSSQKTGGDPSGTTEKGKS